jgi:hypothetical protein
VAAARLPLVVEKLAAVALLLVLAAAVAMVPLLLLLLLLPMWLLPVLAVSPPPLQPLLGRSAS